MKRVLVIAFAVFCLVHTAFAGGSIEWESVADRLAKSCPDLLYAITMSFDVDRVGGALRLGPHSVDVVEGRAEVGTRVPPYEFECKVKGSQSSYNLRIEISDSGDGWKFIVRTKESAEPADAGNHDGRAR